MPDQIKYLNKLRDSHVLVIGGSSGIGLAVAEAVIEHGGSVCISSSQAHRVAKAVSSLESSYPSAKGRISGHACNMADESIVEGEIIELLEKVGTVDHIVYTAGDSIPPTAIEDANLERIRSAGAVRYTAPIFLAKHAPKYMRSKSSECSITLTTGVVADRPMENWSVIAGMRAAVVALGRNLALDLRPIRVNVVSLGAVDTETWSHLAPDAKVKVFERLVSKSTTGRMALASDVAEAYLYCMKDQNVTGSVISTNGGALLL